MSQVEDPIPLIIRSSPRALLGRFAVPSISLLVTFLIGIYLLLQEHTANGGKFLLVSAFLATMVATTRLLMAWLRIRHTDYAVYPNQVQESSYLLKMLGARNNTVRLNEIKQLHCYSNGWLDVWFSNCGKIQMVTSGDQVDFIMENVFDPMKLKDQRELRLFGEVAENAPGLRASPGSPS